MRSRHLSFRSALAMVALAAAACSLIPLQLFDSEDKPTAPITLRRCDESEDVLCLITFGLGPPDQMVVTLLRAPGMPAEIGLAITYLGDRLDYRCESTEAAPTVLDCRGPQIPLGSTVLLEVFSMDSGSLLASGEFVLTALALPTISSSGIGFPSPGAIPPAGTAYPTPPHVPGFRQMPKPDHRR